jgi:hypothetical protein
MRRPQLETKVCLCGRPLRGAGIALHERKCAAVRAAQEEKAAMRQRPLAVSLEQRDTAFQWVETAELLASERLRVERLRRDLAASEAALARLTLEEEALRERCSEMGLTNPARDFVRVWVKTPPVDSRA